MGYVYILHFSQPICPTHPCQHYTGYAEDIDQRIRQHQQGTGSRLCQVAKQRNIRFCLAELLKGERDLERRIKAYKNSKKMCPICQKKA